MAGRHARDASECKPTRGAHTLETHTHNVYIRTGQEQKKQNRVYALPSYDNEFAPGRRPLGSAVPMALAIDSYVPSRSAPENSNTASGRSAPGSISRGSWTPDVRGRIEHQVNATTESYNRGPQLFDVARPVAGVHTSKIPGSKTPGVGFPATHVQRRVGSVHCSANSSAWCYPPATSGVVADTQTLGGTGERPTTGGTSGKTVGSSPQNKFHGDNGLHLARSFSLSPDRTVHLPDNHEPGCHGSARRPVGKFPPPTAAGDIANGKITNDDVNTKSTKLGSYSDDVEMMTGRQGVRKDCPAVDAMSLLLLAASGAPTENVHIENEVSTTFARRDGKVYFRGCSVKKRILKFQCDRSFLGTGRKAFNQQRVVLLHGCSYMSNISAVQPVLPPLWCRQ